MAVLMEADIPYYGGETAVSTPIRDGRAVRTSWVEEGFEIRTWPSSVRDWTSTAEVDRYSEDLRGVVTDEVGCDVVLFYPAIVRSAELGKRHKDLGPIEAAHSDYNETYGPMLRDPAHPYLDVVQPSMERIGFERERIADAKRILTLQFWRNIGPARPDRPLALCDTNSVRRDEFVDYPVDTYAGQVTRFESLLLHPPARVGDHRWYTFPAMSPDEVLVFRAFDSDRVSSGDPFWTPHTAFVDPTAGPDAPGRESVEMRAICLFF